MNQDLPVNVDPIEEKGTITYATEVIATIVGVATTEVEGISSMAGAASISELLSGRPKNLSRGVRVEVGAEEVAVDVSVIVDYGMPIQAVGRNVQENIRKSIETMTGLHVIKVDVHVLGVSFEKENKELEQGQEVARLQSGPQFGGILKAGAADAGKHSKKAAEVPREEASPASEVALEATSGDDCEAAFDAVDAQIDDLQPEPVEEVQSETDEDILDSASSEPVGAGSSRERKPKQPKLPKKGKKAQGAASEEIEEQPQE